ncbi:MAG: hypothetical protein K1X28_09795 [Parachlamydiales bacterium]|nr:hypothetical protein [Parachlamydiales bacterium]
MTSSISFTRAAQVGVCAVAADLFLNQGRWTSGLLLATLGSSALEILKETINAAERSRYRVIKYTGFDIPQDVESLKRALQRIKKDYSDEYEDYLEKNQLSSEQEILDHFQKKLSKGCCYGIANTLFDKILRGQGANIQESARRIESEDAFYHQISQTFTTSEIEGAERVLHLKRRCKQISKLEAALKVLEEAFERKEIPVNLNKGDNDQKLETQEVLLKMQERHPLLAFSSSDRFPAIAPFSTYREKLEEALTALGKENIIGIIDLPKHVVSFQYGPAGYFIYDSFNQDKGLFQYPNAETFFREMRKHVLYDLQGVKNRVIEEENPNLTSEEILKDAKELVNKVEIIYRLYPIDETAG